jgi:curved DNA-binding protein CbpA
MTQRYSKTPIKNLDYIVDYYSILELTETHGSDWSEQLKKQYRKLSKQHHPDLFEHASDKVKNEVRDRMLLIQEAYKILLHEKSKKIYDEKLAEFQKNCPDLISKSGIPILPANRESFDLDFLLSDSPWDFQDAMKAKVKSLSGYNETVFNIIEQQYLKEPNNLTVKEAYLDQLAHKKAYLDLEEDFAWQDVGILNAKMKYKPGLGHVEQVVFKLEQLKENAEKNIELRLLSIDSRPLLVYDGSIINQDTKSTELTTSLLKEKTLEMINKRSQALLKSAQLKEEHLNKMVKVRKFEQIAKIENSQSILVLLHSNSLIIIGLFCEPDSNNNADVKAEDSFKGIPVSQIREKPFTRNTFLLEFNPEIEMTFQIMDFMNDFYENKIEKAL